MTLSAWFYTLTALTLALGCDAPEEATCLHDGARLKVGEHRDDPWICLRCTCEERGLRCIDLEGCVSLDAPQGRLNPNPRDASTGVQQTPRDAGAAEDVDVDGARPDEGAPSPPCDVDLTATTDTDRDGLEDREEAMLGTDPCAVDTDGDGQSDGAEVTFGSAPLDPSSQLERYAEVGVEGVILDTTWAPQLKQVDVTFLLDQTNSMGRLVNGLTRSLIEIAEGIKGELPEPSFGLATFADYAYETMGNLGDLPFYLQIPQTQDVAALTRALQAVRVSGGGDTPEACLEALRQALTGEGYDMRCDGRFDEAEDVPPRSARPFDLFNGQAPSREGGLGKRGGMGYRSGALPIIIYGTDAPFREPVIDGGPGGCPADAQQADVIAGVSALGARLIGITLTDEAEVDARALAEATGSLDVDGAPLVYSWQAGEALSDLIIEAVGRLSGGLRFEAITVELVTLEEGGPVTVAGTIPEALGPFSASALPATLDFDVRLVVPAPAQVDQLLRVDLRLIADGAVELGQQSWIVRVPAVGAHG